MVERGVACCPHVCSQLFKMRHDEKTIAKHALRVHSSPTCQFDSPAGRIEDVKAPLRFLLSGYGHLGIPRCSRQGSSFPESQR